VNGSLMRMPSICTAMMSSPDRSAPIHSFMRVADNWRRVYRTNFGSAARTTVNVPLLSARCGSSCKTTFSNELWISK
jgi:hypothetical protein